MFCICLDLHSSSVKCKHFKKYSLIGFFFIYIIFEVYFLVQTLLQDDCCPYCFYNVNSALLPFGVASSSTSFGWGKDGNVTSAGWQVTLCDPMWHASSRSGVATLQAAIHLLLTYLLEHLRPLD